MIRRLSVGVIAVVIAAPILIWTATTATRFAFRYRVTDTPMARRLAGSAAWLFGAALATASIVFIASLFGLTGA